MIIYILSIPIFLECLDYSKFTIDIPGSPYSVGQIFFILIGFIHLPKSINLKNGSIIFLSIYLLLIFGSLLSANIVSILRSIGTFILVLASIGFVWIFQYKQTYNLVKWFCYVSLSYWIIYVLTKIIQDGSVLSYGFQYSEQEVLNHHVVGMALSMSSLFIIVHNYKKRTVNKLYIYLIFIVTFITILLTESRSNLVVFIIISVIIYYIYNKMGIKNILFFALLLLISLFFAESLFKQNERIKIRYSRNLEFQIESNQTRVMIYKLIGTEIFSNPFGKGMIEGGRINLETNYTVSPHNQFLGFLLQGGIIIIIPIGFFIKRLFVSSRQLFKYPNKFNAKTSSFMILIFSYWMTLLTIDHGGLFYHVMIAITLYLFYLFSSFKMARPSAMKYN